MPVTTASKPMCVRLPQDLDEALRARALAEGLSPSEMLRSIVANWVYGQAPSVDEGYYQARQTAIDAAHFVLTQLFEQHVPMTYDQALAIVEARKVRSHSR